MRSSKNTLANRRRESSTDARAERIMFSPSIVEGQFVVRISPDSNRIEAFKKELWAKSARGGRPEHRSADC